VQAGIPLATDKWQSGSNDDFGPVPAPGGHGFITVNELRYRVALEIKKTKEQYRGKWEDLKNKTNIEFVGNVFDDECCNAVWDLSKKFPDGKPDTEDVSGPLVHCMLAQMYKKTIFCVSSSSHRHACIYFPDGSCELFAKGLTPLAEEAWRRVKSTNEWLLVQAANEKISSVFQRLRSGGGTIDNPPRFRSYFDIRKFIDAPTTSPIIRNNFLRQEQFAINLFKFECNMACASKNYQEYLRLVQRENYDPHLRAASTIAAAIEFDPSSLGVYHSESSHHFTALFPKKTFAAAQPLPAHPSQT
jgi:hypothetical protein